MFEGDVFSLCRLCLSSGDRGIDIFNPKGKDGLLLWIILKELVEIQASRGDGLPHTICEKCMKKLSDFKNFKMMCINSRIEFLKLQINSGLVGHSNNLEDDIFHLCRLCLKSGDWEIDILDRKGTHGLLLWVVMKELVEIKVYQGDGLPHSICHECMKNLTDFKNFKIMSINARIEFLKLQMRSGLVITHGNDEEASPGPSEIIPVHGSNQASVKSEESDEDVQGEDPFSSEADERTKSEASVKLEESDEDVQSEDPFSSEADERTKSEASAESEESEEDDVQGKGPFISGDSQSSQSNMGDVSIHGVEVESSGNKLDGTGCGVVDKGQEADSEQDTVSRLTSSPVVEEESDTVSNAARATGGTDAYRRRPKTAMRGSVRGRSSGRGGSRSCLGRRKVREKFICVECGASSVCKLTLSTHIRAHLRRKEDTCAAKGGGQGQENEHGTNISLPNYEEVFGTCRDLDREGFICDHCGKDYSRKTELISHLRSVHLKVCVVESTAPKKIFSSQKSSRVFTQKPKKREKTLWVCDCCGKGFLKKAQLVRHITSVHLGRKPLFCDICSKSFSGNLCLKAHVIAVHIGERRFKCEKCIKAFKTNNHLKVHMLTHLEKRPFPCTLCPRSFLLEYLLKSHMESHSRPKHTCEICGKDFESKRLLQTHRQRHSEERLFKCEQCPKAYKTKSDLNLHSLVHSRLRKYSCGVCGKKFTQSGSLSSHMRTHDGKRPFECEVCSKKFARKNTLKVHMRTHDGKKPFECELCHKKFALKGNLSGHMRTHDGQKPFECELCHKKFSQGGALGTHMRVHDGKRPFECKLCHKKFSRSSHVSTHMRTHDGKRPFECEQCHKKFAWKGNLSGHMRTHDGRKPFECEVCHKKFSQSGHLKNHMRTHDGKRPFECEVCHHKFSFSSNLRTHMRIHDGIRPFECEVCHKKFSQSGNLKDHIERHKERSLECKLCHKLFKTILDLRVHVKRHSSKKMASTSVRSAVRRSNLRTH